MIFLIKLLWDFHKSRNVKQFSKIAAQVLLSLEIPTPLDISELLAIKTEAVAPYTSAWTVWKHLEKKLTYMYSISTENISTVTN